MSATADELFAPDFPHATPDGWLKGCRGNFCSGRELFGLTCAQAWVRYQGDYRYRKHVLAGWTPEQVVEFDRAEAEAARERAKQERARAAKPAPARKVRRTRPIAAPVAVTPKPKVKAVRSAPAAPAASGKRRNWTPDEDATVRFLNSRFKTDREIAVIVGRDRETVRRRRAELMLPARGKPGRPRKNGGAADVRIDPVLGLGF